MFGNHHHHHGHRHGRGAGPRGGWDQWGERMEQRFAEMFGNGRGGGGRRRMFSGDELRLVLLKLIAERARHGYDLIREIETLTAGAYAPSPGVVYPTVTLLADMDLIAEQPGEGAKKVFAITPAGEAHLAERAEEVAALMDRLKALGSMSERSNRGPVQRAVGNLRQVIHQKLHDDAVDGGAPAPDRETSHAIADILDDAARRIERL
jgi:DNA-binding PadR family transcriptional regulator